MNERSTTRPERFYVPTDICGTHEGARIASSWLERHGPSWGDDPIIVIPTTSHALRDSYIADLTERYRWITSLAYLSARTAGWPGGVAVLMFPNARVLTWFDRSPLTDALCVVQGSAYDTTAWAKAFRPEDLTRGGAFDAGPDIDPVVEQALRSLQAAPAWHGLTRASDTAMAVRTLRLLEDHGHRFTAIDLEAWALAQGWKPTVASRLGSYAAKVTEGDHIALDPGVAPDRQTLEGWRSGASLGVAAF